MHTLYIYATRRLWAAALLLLCLPALTAQEAVPALSLDSCHAWAQRGHPTARRYALTDQNEADAASNAAKGALPQLMMAGQATLQSATTHIPFTLPGIDLPEIAKDQYRLYAEAVQPLTDLLTVRDNVRLAHADAAAERSRVDVEMHSLKARVNSLFFGILAVDEWRCEAQAMHCVRNCSGPNNASQSYRPHAARTWPRSPCSSGES